MFLNCSTISKVPPMWYCVNITTFGFGLNNCSPLSWQSPLVRCRGFRRKFSFADASAKMKPGLTVTKRLEGVDASQTWSEIDGSEFMVRCGPDYEKNGNKAPSGPAFYDVVSVDCIDSGSSLQSHVAQRMELPEAPAAAEVAPLPPLFIINWQLPYNAPALGGSKKAEKAPGSNLIIVCRLAEHTITMLKLVCIMAPCQKKMKDAHAVQQELI